MSEKKTDLLDELLSIEGDAPVDLLVGGHSLHVRRAHTGMQIVQWQSIEADRIEAREEVLANKDLDDAAKVQALSDVGLTYLKNMLKFLCEKPTTDKEINAVAKLLKSSSGQLFNKVTARIFMESGLFTEDGKHVPFIQPSETKENTDD